MNEEEMEIKEKEKSQQRFEEMMLWLNKAEIDFEIKTWESGEGKDIIVKQKIPTIISFYDSGYIVFGDEDE